MYHGFSCCVALTQLRSTQDVTRCNLRGLESSQRNMHRANNPRRRRILLAARVFWGQTGAPPALYKHVSKSKQSHIGHALRIENPVQVVAFMLHHPRMKAVRLAIDRHTLLVKATVVNVCMA